MPLPILLNVCLSIAAGAAPKPAPQAKEPSTFVFESDGAQQWSFTDDVFHIQHGGGWLRTRQVHNDFTMTAQFRLLDGTTDAGVGIRALTGDTLWPAHGYRVALSAAGSSGSINARNAALAPVTSSPVPPLAVNDWHVLVVIATGRRVRVSIDGRETMAADIEDRTGVLLFDVQQGSMDVRAFKVSDAGPTDFHRPGERSEPARRVKDPRLVKEVKPNYSAAAMRHRVEGHVETEMMVEVDGSVSQVRITRFLDPDLEQQAVYAVTRWRFQPGTLEGVPVRVLSVADLSFTLGKR